MDQVSFKNIVLIMGAFCSIMIGAATATGQEIVQYLTVYGVKGALGVCIVSTIVDVFIIGIIMVVGRKANDETGLAAYEILFGKHLGTIIAWFVPLGLLAMVVVMLSGTGATIEQFFGLNKDIGCAIAVIVIVGCAVLGFSKFFSGLGSIGTVLMFVVIIFAVIIIASSGTYDFQAKEAFMAQTNIPAAASNWFMSAINYSLFGVTLGVQIYAAMGMKANNNKEIFIGISLGNVVFAAVIFIMSIAMELHIEDIWDDDIPFLSVITDYNQTAGLFYAVLVLVAVLTTLTPLVWEALVRIGPEKSKRFYIAAVAMVILGYFGGLLPFAQLVNLIYPIIGYLGFAILFATIAYPIRLKLNKIPEDERLEK